MTGPSTLPSVAQAMVEDDDLVSAARAAAGRVRAALPSDVRIDIASVFVSGGNPVETEEALLAVAELLDARGIVGCDAYGVLGGEPARGLEGRSAVSIWAAVLPGARVRAFHLEVMRADDELTVLGLPAVDETDKVAVILADPWSFPVDGFVDWSAGVLKGLPIVGGLASGATNRRGATRLLVDGHVHHRGAVGIIVGGDVPLRTMVSQGCRPIGQPLTVTRAAGGVIYEIAGQAALRRATEVVEALPVEERALAVRGLHIGIALDEYRSDHSHGDFLVRGILGADQQTGALTVGDVVDVGTTVAFHLRDAEAATADLTERLAIFAGQQHGDSVGALLFTCNGRGRALFDDPAHDVLAVSKLLGTDAVAGFFAAGEIGPVGGRTHLHGFTATLLVVGDGSEFVEAGP